MITGPFSNQDHLFGAFNILWFRIMVNHFSRVIQGINRIKRAVIRILPRIIYQLLLLVKLRDYMIFLIRMFRCVTCCLREGYIFGGIPYRLTTKARAMPINTIPRI